MRVGNLVVSVLGLVGGAAAVAMAWRWRRVPLIAARPSPTSWQDTMSDATRTLGAVVSAGVVAGLLVLGFAGRLVMRLLAATSGSAAQGRLTEAGERVGEITTDGTIGFLVFVGLGGGLVTALAYLVLRRWLPNTAGAAGPVVGLILVGSLGVLDPLSPDNVDFAILRPTWLAIGAVVATGLLYACTYTAVAARLDHLIVETRQRRRWLPCAALPLALIPPFAVFSIVYIAARLIARGTVKNVLTRRLPMLTGHAMIAATAVVTLVIVVVAATRIAVG